MIPSMGNGLMNFVIHWAYQQKHSPNPFLPLQIVGGISKSGAEAAGLYPGTPIIAGTTDTAAEVFGTGALTPGQTIIKLATVGRIAAVSQNPLDHPTVLNYPHVLPGLWYPGTCTKFAASAFSWARQVFWDQDGHHYDYKRMNQAVETVPPGSDGLLFHPYLAGEFAPSWDPHLRASFLGVGINHQRAHFTRAVMEGVAYALRDALMSILEMGLYVKELRLIGGGATSGIWGQIITDNLQREVLVPEGTDAAYGSALLAGIAAGMFDKSSEGIDHLIKIRSRLTPEKRHMIIYDELFSIYKQSADATKALSHRLHAFQTSESSKVGGLFVRISKHYWDQIRLEIKSLIGKDNVLSSEMDRLAYGVDYFWVPRMLIDRGESVPLPDIVVKPGTVDEVSAIVKVSKYLPPTGNSFWGRVWFSRRDHARLWWNNSRSQAS